MGVCVWCVCVCLLCVMYIRLCVCMCDVYTCTDGGAAFSL